MADLSGDFTHFDSEGRARMVNVEEKDITPRRAVASGRIFVNAGTFRLIQSGGVKKGDVLTVAQVAGIMGAKRTPDLIPMCHPITLNGVNLSLSLDEEAQAVSVRAEISCAGRTGVEMEALTAVSVALLTVYDMCKSVQRDMVIGDIRLLSKSGGVHGDYACAPRV
ncbi:MAG: cyclic pyranopterin monophosphate synthase MoaC [Fretibacterium sp.]|nr:cyclic pyranopterin monophosphate synthase MoaC [Fretibacterium sp.]